MRLIALRPLAGDYGRVLPTQEFEAAEDVGKALLSRGLARLADDPVTGDGSDFAVIIPSKRITNLVACMEALRRHEPAAAVIVIDDGLELPKELPLCLLGVWLIPGVQPFIYARNCNLGIRAAGDLDVVLLNDDALLETPGGLSKLRQQWRSHPEYGIIGGALNWCGNPNQNKKPGARLRDEAVMIVFACVFIPRETIRRIGLLDERFGANAGGEGPRGYGCEDDDYSWRVRNAGLKLGVYDGCVVNHTKLPSTFRSDPEHPADVRVHERMFLEKHGKHPRLP